MLKTVIRKKIHGDYKSKSHSQKLKSNLISLGIFGLIMLLGIFLYSTGSQLTALGIFLICVIALPALLVKATYNFIKSRNECAK